MSVLNIQKAPLKLKNLHSFSQHIIKVIVNLREHSITIKLYTMKKLSFLLSLFFLSIITVYAQNIYTVNNNIGASANFNDLQVAVNTVPANSILLVHGSAITYGNITVRKPLSIIGTGYFIGSNQAPYTQANLGTSKLYRLTLDAGSNGSLVSGLTIDNWLVVDSTSNVTVSRNFINHGSYSTISYSTNVQFIQNYSNANLEMHYSTVTITNNIFYNNSYLNNNYTTTTISNNIFDRNSNSYSVLNLGSGSSSNFSNNILINSATSASSTICGGCGAALTATNNVSSDSTFRGTNNAVLNAGITTIFSQYNNSNTSFDSKYILTSGSPALGAGTGNTDAGIFAGINSYVLSGIPFIPNIYGLEIPNIGTTGSGLKVRIKAQTNN